MSDYVVPLDQNNKWKKRLANSQLSDIIVRIKTAYGLDAIRVDGFSWRDLVIDGESVVPDVGLDQEDSDLCIIYSSKALFNFQLKLLCTEFEEAKGLTPSLDYMKTSQQRLECKTSIDNFLMKLARNNLTDDAEFSKVKSLAKNQVKRFAVDYEYIEPEMADFVPATKEAIDVAGGVLISMLAYKVDFKTKVPILENGKKVLADSVDYEKPNGRKRKRVTKFLAHVVFGYGHETVDGKTVFNYLNSYGNNNNKGGHEVCSELNDICEVFVPQLSFKNDGFKKLRKAGRKKRRYGRY